MIADDMDEQVRREAKRKGEELQEKPRDETEVRNQRRRRER